MTTAGSELLISEREKLHQHFSSKMETAYNLNRKVVSFQANKDEPFYRWFKYKEGFSSSLVKYFLSEYSPNPGNIIDPFAGAGTTLFAAQELGWRSYGVELLPVGSFAMKTRVAIKHLDIDLFKKISKKVLNDYPSVKNFKRHINHILITEDAFPDETDEALNKYLTLCETIKDEKIKTILQFAAFSILEEISYTRKDGQYLRWDYRSKRNLPGKPFDIGKIYSFEEALKRKFGQIIDDFEPQNLSLFYELENRKADILEQPVNIIQGSCLEELPKFEDNFFDFILTSPPYCNRYDYTRTYALELVYLGYNNEQVRNLRQTMLSCTVENKEKRDYLLKLYSSRGREKTFENVLSVYNSSSAMSEVNSVLDELNKIEKLNNSNVARMVKNYFLEMCFVINEMARITKSGGYCVMVNDNVRYGGEEIPVDLILSEFAEHLGFTVEKIFVLPRGKGNSSQQMGNYGRTEVRKCVYLWRKQ